MRTWVMGERRGGNWKDMETLMSYFQPKLAVALESQPTHETSGNQPCPTTGANGYDGYTSFVHLQAAASSASPATHLQAPVGFFHLLSHPLRLASDYSTQ